MADLPHVPSFDLPVHELRNGYRSDVYFWREKVALERRDLHPRVTVQVFQKHAALLCGMAETLAVLKLGTGRYRDAGLADRLFERFMELKILEREKRVGYRPAEAIEAARERRAVSDELESLWEAGFEALHIEALADGDRIAPRESVLHITGDASLFAHLETVYLGILSRRTRLATNVRSVVEAAAGKPVLFFSARFDHWALQEGDGYAAWIGGARGVSTPAQGAWWGGHATGTVPHALIAAMGGNTVFAVRCFAETFPEVPLVALVDYDNDCVGTSLACARALGTRLWGVRLDTSGDMVDRSMLPVMGGGPPTGVTPELVGMVREALDREGHEQVRIVVSGGFDAAKVALFEQRGAPVDVYGVGSALLTGRFDFTADVVLLDGKPCAKRGRWYRPNAGFARNPEVGSRRSDL